MKYLLIFLLITMISFAQDTFTLEETKLIDKQINSAVNKKFTLEYLQQIEKNAASKYLLFKVGDKFTANSGGRHFTGTIRNVNQRTVRLGDFLINMRDYPDYYFDKITNDRMRKSYISKYYHQAKNSYRQRADKYYRNKILAKRPPEARPAIVEQQAVITIQKQPIPQEFDLNINRQPLPKSKVNLPRTVEEHYHQSFNGLWAEYDLDKKAFIDNKVAFKLIFSNTELTIDQRMLWDKPKVFKFVKARYADKKSHLFYGTYISPKNNTNTILIGSSGKHHLIVALDGKKVQNFVKVELPKFKPTSSQKSAAYFFRLLMSGLFKNNRGNKLVVYGIRKSEVKYGFGSFKFYDKNSKLVGNFVAYTDELKMRIDGPHADFWFTVSNTETRKTENWFFSTNGKEWLLKTPKFEERFKFIMSFESYLKIK